jgi:hypothetical protein
MRLSSSIIVRSTKLLSDSPKTMNLEKNCNSKCAIPFETVPVQMVTSNLYLPLEKSMWILKT